MDCFKPFIGTKLVSEFTKTPDTYLLGIPFDGTASFRPGQRFAPQAIRDASENLETYSPYLHLDLTENQLCDLGDLPYFPSHWESNVSNFEKTTREISLNLNNSKLVTLGGEHSISFIPIKTYLSHYQQLTILHLDAHADLRPGYLGHPHSHASIIYNAQSLFRPGHDLIQYGIRSGTKEEFFWMREKKTLMKSLDELCTKLDKIHSDRPIYLTLDLDFFDPAYFPGTGTPEAGGENFHSFIKIIKILSKKNFVGADITELLPSSDLSGNSNCFASKIVREVFLALNN